MRYTALFVGCLAVGMTACTGASVNQEVATGEAVNPEAATENAAGNVAPKDASDADAESFRNTANAALTSVSFRNAVNAATAAAELTQTAKTEGDWLAVAEKWEQAKSLMESVPESAENYSVAQAKAQEYQTNLQYATDNAQKLKAADKLSRGGGGLGDRQSVFDEKYGAGIDQGVFIRYSNDFVLATFLEERAYSIQLQFETLPEKRVSKAQALQMAEMLMPEDAVKVSERQERPGAYVIRYESKTLAQSLSEDSFFEDPPGVFIVLLQSNENDSSTANIFGAIVALGDNP